MSDVIQKIISANPVKDGSIVLGANKFGVADKIGPPISASGIGYYNTSINSVESGLINRFDNEANRWEKWDDLTVPANSLRLGNTIADYTQYYGSLYLPAFAGTTTPDQAFFATQLPHSYKVGTHIYPHVHWSPGPSGVGYENKSVAWILDLSWGNINETFPGATSYSGIDSWTTFQNYEHRLVRCVNSGVNYMDGTGKDISSMIVGRIVRQNDRGDDTYTPPAFLLEIDFHYQKDGFGSTQELIK